MRNKHTDKKKNTTVLYLGKMSGGSWGVKGAPGVIRTTETDKLAEEYTKDPGRTGYVGKFGGYKKLRLKTDKENIRVLIESGELDLGFCKVIKKEIKGGKGKSHGTEFKIRKYYKLGVIMSDSFKKLLNR